jgi:hypothetical protein
MWRRVGGLGLVRVATAISTVIACRQAIGIDQYFNASTEAGTDAGSTACGLPYGTTACASCINANCCGVSTACAADAPCGAYFECLAACKIGDWQCRAQCQVDHAFSHASEMPALAACTVANCETACGLTCGEVGAWNTPPAAAASCHSCFATNNCAGARACSSSADCVGWVQCISGCTTPDCRLACPSPEAGTNDAQGALISTFAPGLLAPSFGAGCSAAECGSPDWSCVGHVVWPGGIASATMLAHVQDWITSQPVSGAEVSICGFFDPNCNSPYAGAQTDGSGNASLPLQVGLGPDAYAQINSPTIVPTLYWWGYQASEPRASLAHPWVLTFTPAELQAIVASSGEPSWDSSSLGWVAAQVLDCSGGAASGVSVTIDVKGPTEVPYYLVNQAPSFTATQTSTNGEWGMSNVPPGIVNLTATPIGMDKPSSQGHVLVRPGTISVLFMYPTPCARAVPRSIPLSVSRSSGRLTIGRLRISSSECSRDATSAQRDPRRHPHIA